jgi:ankyrin repeat protein
MVLVSRSEMGIDETPLILASVGGHVEVSRFLIEHQADVNSLSDDRLDVRYTQHHESGHTDVVRLLLDHGADVNVQKADSLGSTSSRISSWTSQSCGAANQSRRRNRRAE